MILHQNNFQNTFIDDPPDGDKDRFVKLIEFFFVFTVCQMEKLDLKLCLPFAWLHHYENIKAI